MSKNKRKTGFEPAFSVASETLESRLVLSASTLHAQVAQVAPLAMHQSATTKLDVKAGTLGQPITFTATVKAPAKLGAPQGSVNFIYNGQVIQTIPLAQASKTGGGFTSKATYTFSPVPGGGALYFGKYTAKAQFVPTGFPPTTQVSKSFTVPQPKYTQLAGGLKLATVVPGSGPTIQTGQTANVLYTGYLASNGQIFDASLAHGGTPFSFQLGAGQVVPGFDTGTTGMKVGETRLVSIPPSLGYGSTASGPIPANSTLVFLITLASIS